MTQADRIRQFALDRYIVPARTRNDVELVIRAGDVHREMGLFSAMPAVCSAIGSRKFEEVSGATFVNRTGPTNGANVYFHFSLRVGSQPARPPAPLQNSRESSAQTSGEVDLTNSIALVSCVKSNQWPSTESSHAVHFSVVSSIGSGTTSSMSLRYD